MDVRIINNASKAFSLKYMFKKCSSCYHYTSELPVGYFLNSDSYLGNLWMLFIANTAGTYK